VLEGEGLQAARWIHGTCSKCGGAVTTPDTWLGIRPPTPSCEGCGATKKQPHGPTVLMEPRRKPEARLGEALAEAFVNAKL
jgi:hypothetical protein